MVWRAPSFGGVLPLKYYPQFCHSTTEDTTVGSETGYSSANNASMLNPCSHDKSTVCLASGTSVNSPRGLTQKRPRGWRTPCKSDRVPAMQTKVTRLDYCQYLLVSQINDTLTHFADHCA